MNHHPEYLRRFREKYRELRQGDWREATILETVDDVFSEVRPELEGLWRDNEEALEDLEDEMGRIREWIPERLLQLDAFVRELPATPE